MSDEESVINPGKSRTLRVESYIKHRPREVKVSTGGSEDLNLDDVTAYQTSPFFTRKKCYELYVLYGWEKKDLLRFGMPESTLDTWLYQPTERGPSWKQDRELFEAKVNRAKEEKAIDEIVDIQVLSYELQKRALIERKENPEPLTMTELDKIRKVGETAHTIKRLEEGKPTTIKQNFNLNKKEIAGIIEELDELDPFIDYDSKRIN